jgi:hypothetical protein
MVRGGVYSTGSYNYCRFKSVKNHGPWGWSGVTIGKTILFIKEKSFESFSRNYHSFGDIFQIPRGI